jgi:4-hydroxy-3-polyprenylbenzoate decarboxylase
MQKVIVAITGASGAIYAQMLVQKLCTLKQQVAEVALIASNCGKQVFVYELGENAWDNLLSLSIKRYGNADFFAPTASGSARYDTMFVVPCSMGTLAHIAHGIADTLIARSADVMLKERRRLILLPREMPYSAIHLQNMLQITQAGGIVCPASPAFYTHPATIDDLVEATINRILQLADIQVDAFEWGTNFVA